MNKPSMKHQYDKFLFLVFGHFNKCFDVLESMSK